MEDEFFHVPTPDPTSLESNPQAFDWIPNIGINFGAATELLESGGPVVAILAAMSVVALTVILFKGFQFLLRGIGRERRTESALTNWLSGRRNDALAQLSKSWNPSARVLRHAMSGVNDGIAEGCVREDAERVALTNLADARSCLRILESISQIAPLLGLFGTVIGMMSAFQALQTSGADADPAVLAGGIWVALITTAVGLAVAIPTSFALYWLEGRIERETTLIEASLTSLFTGRLNLQSLPNQNAQTLDNVTRLSPDAAEYFSIPPARD